MCPGVEVPASVAARDDALDRHRTGAGDGSVSAESEHEWSWPSFDGEAGPRTREAKSVGLLIRRQKRAVDENATVDEVQPPFPGAFKDAGHCGARLRPLFAGGGQDGGEHLAEGSEEGIAGARGGKTAGGDAAIDGAVFRREGLLPRESAGAGFDGVVLIVRLFLVGVVGILLAFLEGFRAGDLVRSWLLTCGKELLDRSSSHVGVLHEPVRHDVVGMADHAGAGVGCVPYVAVFDYEALAVTDIGDVGKGIVLLGGEGHGEPGQEDGDS